LQNVRSHRRYYLITADFFKGWGSLCPDDVSQEPQDLLDTGAQVGNAVFNVEGEYCFGGRNLTLGTTASGDAVEVAEVPLAPIIQWLVEVRDPLLHEERIPQQTERPSVASEEITQDGYDKALEFREASGIPGRAPVVAVNKSGRFSITAWG